MSYLPIKIGGIIMYLYELIEKYGRGASNEKMQKLTMILSDFLAPMKQVHKEKYWMLMRDVFGLLNDYHYDEEFAEHDVKNMQPLGEYWNIKQIDEATKSMTFPVGTTIYDRYVAFNAFANDLKGSASDEDILKAAHAFWFNDKDYKGKNKIWCYMKMVYANSEK